MIYEFNDQTLVFAYNNSELIGMFVLYKGNQMTKDEMFNIFDHRADLMITVPVKNELPDVTGDSLDEEIDLFFTELQEECGEIYNRALKNTLTDSECQYQISKIAHWGKYY